ncbi:MAG: hypothetical protein KGL48_06080 [Sphingomonadales bacterium]|nr:hypothetical protein [Sphingomonadales bacterium]MDE2568946.1 hypothetical protein [Sphingomonadales bacterium]
MAAVLAKTPSETPATRRNPDLSMEIPLSPFDRPVGRKLMILCRTVETGGCAGFQ